jgi:flagellar assembly protein FliH
MLSRVLTETEAQVTPAVWRNRDPGSGVSVVRPERKFESEAKAREARNEELNAAIEQRVRQAYESGFREGEAAARQSAESQVREAVEKLAATVVEVAATRGDAMRRAEADMVRLSVEIARRVLHRELSLDTSALEALIRAALEKLRSQEVYRVRVHPGHEQLVRACLQQIGRDPDIEVVGDASQPRGGAVFEISRGSLDASVETQLREIENGLADHLGERT